jgi:hypothetical protein
MFGFEWWITAVVVALLINLLSAYLKPRIDAALVRTWSWWRERSEARTANARANVVFLAIDDRARAYAHSEMLGAALHAIFLAVGAVACASLGFWVAAMVPELASVRIVGIFVFVVFIAFAWSEFIRHLARSIELENAERWRRRNAVLEVESPTQVAE